MSLQLWIGCSGAGKSYRLYQNLIEESLRNPGQRYVVLVPEQFTMQTQQELVRMHPRHGIMNIDVESFQRLAYHVFDELGKNDFKVLEETGKSLVIRRLAGERRKELSVLGDKLGRMGYVGEMKSILSEMVQYSVGREQLEEGIRAVAGQKLLAGKLRDILVLYEAFQEYKAQEYVTAEELLEVLCQVAGHSSIIRDSVFALDEFTGFTPIQYRLLEKLIKYSQRVLVTVTMDPAEYPFTAIREEELFALSKDTVRELKRIAFEQQAAEEETVVFREEPPRFQGAPELKFLERHLLRYDGAAWEGEPKAVRICRAATPFDEIREAGREIKRLVREEGYACSQIAVVTGDMAGYAPYIERQFADYGIPCFVDNKRNILENPFVEFLRAALKMAEEDFSYASVFRYLRCGLSGISAEETDLMDNYCVAMGIRRFADYAETWTKLCDGQTEEELGRLNGIREKFLAETSPCRERLRGRKNVRRRTEELYRWCVEARIQERLSQYEARFRGEGELALAKEYAQVYRIVMDLFDKLVELLGDEKVGIREYAQILDAGLEDARVGVIPPTGEQVVVGDLERTRLNGIRALFVLGANDGVIPSSEGRRSLLSEMDRQMLRGTAVRMAPTARENSYTQRFYLYRNLTKPSGRLYLSFCRVNRKGEAARPSYLIGLLREMYPGLAVGSGYAQEAEGLPVSEKDGFQLLAGEIRKRGMEDAAVRELAAYYAAREPFRGKLKLLGNALEGGRSSLSISRAAARAIYGEALQGSVTRLEKYAACAYAHYLAYGLRLKERQEYTFAALDLGNILHKALELYTARLDEGPHTWADIGREEQEALMDSCVEEVAQEYGNTVLLSSARNSYMIQRMKQMGRRTVWAITLQVRQGSFVPRGFEVSFSQADHLDAVRIPLEGGGEMRLTGRIDRTDCFEDGENVYVKVVDYKTGNKNFDLSEVYYGLSLQLVVYMSAAAEMEQRTHLEKRVIPAAMLYYHIQDPILETDGSQGESELETAFLKELRMKGLVNSDPDIIRLLDRDIGSSSLVIPVSMTKSGEVGARSSVAATGQIRDLMAYTREKMKEFGEGILEGEISISPFRKGTRTACDYCAYKGVCGFDEHGEGFAFRRLKAFPDEEIWKRMSREEAEAWE